MALAFCPSVAGCTSSHAGDVPSGADGGGEVSDGDVDVAVDGAADASADARAPRPGDPCTTRRDCDDGVFCNGVEECIASVCISPRNAACRDPGGCATSTCVESARGCVVDVPGASSTCTAGQVCLPELGCAKPEGCTSDAECDDARACTTDRCVVAEGRCFHDPVDARCPAVGTCGVGVCLGDRVADPSGCGASPDATKCKTTEGCDATSACVPLAATCVSDRDCTDGTLCDGVERCVAGTCRHADVATCVAVDACHHAICRDRALGDAYCLQQPLFTTACRK